MDSFKILKKFTTKSGVLFELIQIGDFKSYCVRKTYKSGLFFKTTEVTYCQLNLNGKEFTHDRLCHDLTITKNLDVAEHMFDCQVLANK